ncbi:MAG: 1-acyl-sn-glycerol-3-phosphate acyltransferase, partial [Candidatus Obscuribacterales bacterium]|nr:1-acyl-sn-glycerol-3-phosphate acyltransferase [Candidatus Obscuribacterales bacterium]
QITPNHSHFADNFEVPMLVKPFKPRYMAASSVMGGFGGLLGLIIAPMGAFAASFKAALKILRSGECLVIFPEGWTYLDGKMGTFHNGAVHGCRFAAAALKKPSYLLPMCIKYGRYPGPWIMKLPIRLQYAILFFGFILFRSGATVVIGDPIADSSLPTDDTEASQFLRQEISNLKP